MKRAVLVMLFLLLSLPLPALAGGLREGAKVRLVQNGKSFTGTITSARPDQEPLVVINPYGGIVRIPLQEVRIIRATGRKQLLTLPWLFPIEKSFALYEFGTLDGTRIVAVVDPQPVFTIRVGKNGKREEFELEELELIEALQ